MSEVDEVLGNREWWRLWYLEMHSLQLDRVAVFQLHTTVGVWEHKFSVS